MPISADEVYTPFKLMDRPGTAQYPEQQARCLGCDEWLRYDYRADEWEMHTVLECIVRIRLSVPE